MSISSSAPHPSAGVLGADAVARALRLSLIEAPFFALMVGFGETYFVACAVRLGASPLQLGLTVGLPLALGSAGPILALWLLARHRRRRPLVALSAALQATSLVALAAADIAGALDPALLIALACLYQTCALAAGTAWSSWYGDLVPAQGRGRYFARRNRRVQVATLASVLGAGTLLQVVEGGPVVVSEIAGWGFRSIFLLGALFRTVSAVLLWRSPEPAFAGLSSPERTLRFLRTDRGRGAWRLLGFGAVFQLTTYLASPYFTPFMLQELRFTYFELTLATATVIAAKILLLPKWGQVIDAHDARVVFTLCAVMAALVPVPWIFGHGLAMALFAQAFSGASWAGYELSYFSVMLASTYRRTRPQSFAAQNALNGSAQLLGGLAGAWLSSRLGGDFRMVFAASAVSRLLLAAAAPAWLPHIAPGVPIGRRAVLLRVVGFRPHGGLIHRLVLPGSPAEEESGETAEESRADGGAAQSRDTLGARD
ncbi:MAG TPA: MFS transporter [Thermoanaerobaculia bacterium]|nr:MFS transporter [Thermoanaerobaculia bacterium]